MEVYKITCKTNNKIYIGSTKLSKEKRWGDLSSSSSHLSCVRKGKDTPLYNDIKKYGAENFVLETLEIITGDRHKAYERETYWIKYFWNKRSYCYRTYVDKSKELLNKSERILKNVNKKELSDVRKKEHKEMSGLNNKLIEEVKMVEEHSEYVNNKEYYNSLED